MHCLEPSCKDFKKRGGQNLKPHGEAAGTPRFRCVTCGHAFTERHFHPLFPLRTGESKIARVLLDLVRRKSIHEAAADAGVDKNTVLAIIRHMESKKRELHGLLVGPLGVKPKDAARIQHYLRNRDKFKRKNRFA